MVRKRTSAIVFIALIIFSFIFSSYAKQNKASNTIKKYDNKSSSILVMPKMYFINADYVYYISQYDYSIYKMKIDGSQRTRLVKDRVFTDGMLLSGMMVYNGYIYYINDSNGKKLYRVKTDGTGRTCIAKRSIDPSDGMFILNNYLFYFSGWKYYKIALYGKEYPLSSDEEELCKLYFNSFKKLYYNGYLYCSQTDGIYKIKPNGTEKKMVAKGGIYDFTVYNDSVYYIDDRDLCLYRDDKKLLNCKIFYDTGDEWLGGFAVKDGYIYYTNADDNLKLYRIKADGTQKIKISDRSAMSFKVDDYIYYIDDFDNGSLSKVGLDGKDIKPVLGGQLLYVYSIEGDYIFYSAKWEEETNLYLGRCFMVRKDGKNIVELK